MFEPLLLLFLVGFIAAAVWISLSMLRATTGWRCGLILLSSALVVIGACGFFGQGLFAVAGQYWLPQSFEWPAGGVENALTTARGEHIVLVKGVGRVQVYDPNWHFLRGWTVPAVLRLRLRTDGTIEALATGERGFVFDMCGKLTSQRTYGTREFVDVENSLPHTGTTFVPTPRSLYIFSNPLLSWIVFAAGLLGWYIFSPKSNQSIDPSRPKS